MSHVMAIRKTADIAAWLVLFASQALQANTLTIGKGSGVVWQGANFTASGTLFMSAPTNIPTTGGAASVTNVTTECIRTTDLTTINGIEVLPIAPGIGLAPNADFRVNTYTGTGLIYHTMSGTIGLQGTQGTITGGAGGNGVAPAGRAWCLNFSNINPNLQQNLSMNGTWAIVTDGTQQTGNYTLPPMYAASFVSNDSITRNIFPFTTLRVTAIACSIATTTSVNFGTAARNITQFAELANLTAPLTVTCNQDAPDTIDTNINVQFSGKLYNNNTARLALDQGGGYITGEIGNGVTGSGTCDATTGVSFNYADINVGVLGASELNQTYANQITWRLCSGGATLPTGPVTASANVAVTYN
ncbi:hypothetical protein [Candidatus Symbiopectobacterium sp. NZEC135]|uniref:hypothetical protein n=1 Tax=Candidatus Symbiopectobacterium sp. NZEC135 TaxID=2820471 RepID=UPI002226EA0A|nr:hypothetical protein [Candidatus Symbiopectobacterium sp. NZEC135]MCW2478001.1 hypothetical protein [Candidatus Symbiopectobacterium sp. NZEC135]